MTTIMIGITTTKHWEREVRGAPELSGRLLYGADDFGDGRRLDREGRGVRLPEGSVASKKVRKVGM